MEKMRLWVPPQSMASCKVVQYIGPNLVKLTTMTWPDLGATSGSIHCGCQARPSNVTVKRCHTFVVFRAL